MTTALVVGNMIGAGIFLLPTQLAPLGRNAVYGWVVTIAGVLCLALTLVILSKRIPGGPFAYVEQAFGPLASFLVMWAYLVGIWAGNPGIAIAAVSYLSHVLPVLGQPVVAPAMSLAAVWAFVLVNSRGARSGGAVQLVTTILKVLPLLAVALVAAVALGGGAHSATQLSKPISGGSLAAAATLALFSMLGFECPALSLDKIKDSHRIVPVATILGTVITGVVYLGAYAAVLFLLSDVRTAASPAPFADAVEPLLGPAAAGAIAVFAAISALGCVNGWILVAGEVPLTLARDGVFPAWFGKTTRFGTPVRAQVAAGVAASLLIAANFTKSMSGLFAFFALLTTVSSIFLYAAVAAAALVLMGRKRITTALLPLVAIPGLIFSLWAFWGAGEEPSLWGIALLASGIPIHLFTQWRKRSTSRPPELAPAAPVE